MNNNNKGRTKITLLEMSSLSIAEGAPISSQSSQQSELEEPGSGVNKFVIPKKTIESNLIDPEPEEKSKLDNIINELKLENGRDLNANGYKYKDTKMVHNAELEKTFNKSMKELRESILQFRKTINGKKNDKTFMVKYYIYIVEDEHKLMELAKNGFVCKKNDSKDQNFLGSSEYGIHFVKHIDVALQYQYFKKQHSFYLVITKVYLYGVRLVKPSSNNKNSYPSIEDRADLPSDLATLEQPIQERFNHSLVYVYDHDKTDILDKPRNMLPFAVIKCQIENSLFYNVQIFEPSCKKIQRRFGNKPVPPKDGKYRSVQRSVEINNQILQQKQQQPTPMQQIIPLPQKQIISKQSLLPTDLVLDLMTSQPEKQANELEKAVPLMDMSIEPPTAKSDHPVPILETFQTAAKPKKKPKKKSKFKFRAPSSESETDNDDINLIECVEELYTEVIEELYMKPPRWRIMYEKTGRLDFKFRGERKMIVKMDDVRKTNLKFVDEEKTVLNMKDITNSLIFSYQNKKQKKALASANMSALSSNTTSQLAVEPKSSIENYTRLKIRIGPECVVDRKEIQPSKVEQGRSVNQPPQQHYPGQRPSMISNAVKINNMDKLNRLKKSEISNLPKQPNKPSLVNSNPNPKSASEKSILDNIKKEKLNEDEHQVHKPNQQLKKPELTSAGLSSEMTSLEKRLLSKSSLTAKIKETSKVSNANVASTNRALMTLTGTGTSASKTNNSDPKLKENLKKNTSVDTSKKQLPQMTPVKLPEPKRKKNFWEPDSDSEYDKLNKIQKNNAKMKEEPVEAGTKVNTSRNDADDEDGDDDIVIVSRLSLNLPPVQYSKQYYDLNINGFESEMKKFVHKTGEKQNVCNNITSVVKSPIKPVSGAKVQNELLKSQPPTRRQRHMNRQRYIHHIVTNNSLSQFDVENLKQLKQITNTFGGSLDALTGDLAPTASESNTSIVSKNSSSNENNKCLEIHAGGFELIEPHSFEKSLNYLRRTQSFNKAGNCLEIAADSNADSNDSMLKTSTNYQSISLTDLNSPFTNDVLLNTGVNKRLTLNEYNSLKSRSITSNQPLNAEHATETNSPIFCAKSVNSMPQNNSIDLPSVSLIDELKKRVNDERMVDDVEKSGKKKEKSDSDVMENEENDIPSSDKKKSKKKKSKRKLKKKSNKSKRKSKHSDKSKKKKRRKKLSSSSSVSLSSNSALSSSSSSSSSSSLESNYELSPSSVSLSPNLISSDASLGETSSGSSTPSSTLSSVSPSPSELSLSSSSSFTRRHKKSSRTKKRKLTKQKKTTKKLKIFEEEEGEINDDEDGLEFNSVSSKKTSSSSHRHHHHHHHHHNHHNRPREDNYQHKNHHHHRSSKSNSETNCLPDESRNANYDMTYDVDEVISLNTGDDKPKPNEQKESKEKSKQKKIIQEEREEGEAVEDDEQEEGQHSPEQAKHMTKINQGYEPPKTPVKTNENQPPSVNRSPLKKELVTPPNPRVVVTSNPSSAKTTPRSTLTSPFDSKATVGPVSNHLIPNKSTFSNSNNNRAFYPNKQFYNNHHANNSYQHKNNANSSVDTLNHSQLQQPQQQQSRSTPISSNYHQADSLERYHMLMKLGTSNVLPAPPPPPQHLTGMETNYGSNRGLSNDKTPMGYSSAMAAAAATGSSLNNFSNPIINAIAKNFENVFNQMTYNLGGQFQGNSLDNMNNSSNFNNKNNFIKQSNNPLGGTNKNFKNSDFYPSYHSNSSANITNSHFNQTIDNNNKNPNRNQFNNTQNNRFNNNRQTPNQSNNNNKQGPQQQPVFRFRPANTSQSKNGNNPNSNSNKSRPDKEDGEIFD